MTLEKTIENDVKTAMKKRDGIKVSALRLLRSEINNLRLTESKKEITDRDVIKIIQRQIKQRKDSIQQFQKGKRLDLAEKEKKEMEILSEYLPKQLSDDELKEIINQTISELGVTDKKGGGQVIKSVMEKTTGKAEGKRVSTLVFQILH